MAFGIKVEVPKIEVPKVPVVVIPDPAAVVGGIAAGVKVALSGAVAKGSLSLSAVAGALVEVVISFRGPSVDFAIEPHALLEANTSYGDTEFKRGNLIVRVDMDPGEAKTCGDTLRLFSRSGKYNESKPVSEGVASGAATVDVEFTDAPMSDFFSLEVVPAGGKGYLLFVSVPYGDVGKRH